MISEDILDAIGQISDESVALAAKPARRRKALRIAALAAAVCVIGAATGAAVLAKKTSKTTFLLDKATDCAIAAVYDDDPVYTIGDFKRIELSQSFFKSKEAKSEITVKLFDKEITGTYKESIKLPYYQCDVDKYICKEDNGRETMFEINSHTGKVVGAFILCKNGYQSENKNYNYDECLSFAYETLGRITDSDDYIQVNAESSKRSVYMPECGDVYSFYFRRAFGDITSDSIVWIDVNTDGIVTLFSAMTVAALEDITITVSDDIKDFESIVKASIEEIYSSYPSEKIEYIIEEKHLTRLKDGSFGIIVTVGVAIDESGTFNDETEYKPISLFVCVE